MYETARGKEARNDTPNKQQTIDVRSESLDNKQLHVSHHKRRLIHFYLIFIFLSSSFTLLTFRNNALFALFYVLFSLPRNEIR